MKTKAFYTAITTDNADKTLNFYVGTLGFHVAHILKTPKGEITVIENNDGAHIDVIASQDDTPGFHALRTNVDDLDSAIAEFKAAGCEVTGPVDISTGRAILVKDPNGILIDVTQHIRK